MFGTLKCDSKVNDGYVWDTKIRFKKGTVGMFGMPKCNKKGTTGMFGTQKCD